VALDHANMKNSKGLHITGVMASTCAQHGFLLPQGLGDLQKASSMIPSILHYRFLAERPSTSYCNVDYVVFSSLQSLLVLNFIIFSYDIACQWFKKLWVQHTTLPEHLQLDHTSKKTQFVIPKFHMRAHNQQCHTMFSLNLFLGSG
jgi:Kyakuja-Dileera-Zisupton transposase